MKRELGWYIEQLIGWGVITFYIVLFVFLLRGCECKKHVDCNSYEQHKDLEDKDAILAGTYRREKALGEALTPQFINDWSEIRRLKKENLRLENNNLRSKERK